MQALLTFKTFIDNVCINKTVVPRACYVMPIAQAFCSWKHIDGVLANCFFNLEGSTIHLKQLQEVPV